MTADTQALPLDAKLVTPEGWKLMGDIQVGDLVAGRDGNFYPVTGVCPQAVKQAYRVQLNDGTAARCGAAQLWFTRTKADRKSGKPGTVKALAEIMPTLLVGNRTPQLNHQIPTIEPVGFPERELPVHPYLLGSWLGHGRKSKWVELTRPEADIQLKIQALLPISERISVLLSQKKSDRISIHGGTTKKAFKNLGLLELYSYEKFIPEVYKTASVEQRLELLAGLLDTSGYVVVNPKAGNLGNRVEYSTTSVNLRDDVLSLVRSLGGRATFIERMGAYRVDGELVETRPVYRIYISFTSGLCPVSSLKHMARFTHEGNRRLNRAIQEIIPDAMVKCLGISVDSPDGLFLTDDFIPTHN